MAESLGSAVLELDTDDKRYLKGVRKAEGSAEKLDKGFKKTERSGRTLGQRLGALGRRIGSVVKGLFSLRAAAVTAAGATGLFFLVKRAVETADAIGKTADRIGLGVEAYQELAFAAGEAGVAQDLFNTSMTALVRRAGEAIRGNKTFRDSFEDLGITVEDLRSLAPEELLGRVADGVNELGSQSEKIAALDSVMSEAGRRMVNFTRLGSEGIARLRREAREMGIVLGSAMVREAERASDALGRMGKIIGTNLTRALVALAPTIVAVGRAFAEAAPAVAGWVSSLLPAAVAPVSELEKRIDALREKAKLLDEQMAGRNTGPGLGGAPVAADRQKDVEALNREIADLEKILESRRLQEELLNSALTSSAETNTTLAEKISDVRDALQFEIDQLGRSEAEQRLYNEAKQAGIEDMEAYTLAVQPLIEKLEELKRVQAANQNVLKAWQDEQARAKAVFDQTRTPQEKYQARVEELNLLLERGAISQQTYNRAVRQAQDDLEEANKKTGELVDGQEILADTIKNGGDAALRGNMDTWRDWASFALRQIARVWEAFVNAQLNASKSGGSGGGLFDLISQGFGALVGFFGSSPGRPTGHAGTGAGVNNAATPRAEGGPVVGGRPFLVGERGPELFVPRTSGQVFSNGETAQMLGGAGGGMTVNMTLNNPTRDMIPEIIGALRNLGAKVNQIDGGLESRAVSAVTDARGRDPELFGGVA